MVATRSQIPLMTEQRHALERRRQASNCPDLWSVLDAVKDPEVPAITIWELGVLQDIVRNERTQQVVVVITPTYSGCPALMQMKQDILDALAANGTTDVTVETQLSPAWTTDWLTSGTRQKLREYGIAAPDAKACPQCGSTDVEMISEFGSTACKALCRCRACLETFDYFKPH
jgi:ring-1,2-phenylacetyl-CoA epoxidase subunit PaaD